MQIKELVTKAGSFYYSEKMKPNSEGLTAYKLISRIPPEKYPAIRWAGGTILQKAKKKETWLLI